jgi:MoaA/NifB/PqqE/SkfB family radical SAM enzyme
MCPQWKQGIAESVSDQISVERMKSLIDEMAKLGLSEFGISGGEPMIFREKVLSLLAYANQQGLYTHFATNGSLVTKEILDQYEAAGGGHISLSIDGIGKVHDELRGVPNAFAGVTRVLELFRLGNYQKINLKINTVLSNENLDQIIEIAKLAIANKALFFVQPYDLYDFANQYSLSEREEKYPLWVKQKNFGKLKQVLAELIALKKKYPTVILNEEKHLAEMADYFAGQKSQRKCLAAFDNVSINQEGKVVFCKFGELADLKETGLKEYLQSQKRLNMVKAGLACKQGCLLGCMYRPGIKEMLLNGPRQFFRLIKK